MAKPGKKLNLITFKQETMDLLQEKLTEFIKHYEVHRETYRKEWKPEQIAFAAMTTGPFKGDRFVLKKAQKQDQEEKAVKAIKEIRKKEIEAFKQAQWCREHKFNLEFEKFRHVSDTLRRLALEIEDIFETGYISGEFEE